MLRSNKRCRSARIAGAAALIVCSVLSVSACGSNSSGSGGSAASGTSAASSSGSSAATKTVAYVPGIYPEGYFISMGDGIKAEAAKLGGWKVILQGSPTYSPETQLPILQALLSKKLTGAIIAPTDVTALNGTLARFKQAKIPLFLGDTGVSDASLPDGVVETDNLAGGVAAADAMAKQIGGKGTVAVESVEPGVGATAPRVTGFDQEMAKKYPSIKVLPVQYDKDDSSVAASQVGAELTAHPDINGVFGANDGSALGAGQAVKQAGKKVTVIAYDADPDEVKNLKSGLFDVLIAQHPYDEGVTLMKELSEYVDGDRSSIPKVVKTPVTVVTRANMNSPAVHPYLYGVADAK